MVPAPPVLAAGAHGAHVVRLHRLLEARTALPPEAAGEAQDAFFGPVTAGAVASFQAARCLPAAGIVDAATWSVLRGRPDSAAPPRPPAPELERMPPLARAVLAAADGELQARVAEVPAGSNRGPRIDVYLVGLSEDAPHLLQLRRASPAASDGWQGVPWSGRFARWCIERAARQLGVRSPVSGWGDLVHAWEWHDAARRIGAWRPDAAPGRIGLILVGGSAARRGLGHVALVASAPDASGHVWTREGDAGERVAAHLRPVTAFTGGFVDLAAAVR